MKILFIIIFSFISHASFSAHADNLYYKDRLSSMNFKAKYQSYSSGFQSAVTEAEICHSYVLGLAKGLEFSESKMKLFGTKSFEDWVKKETELRETEREFLLDEEGYKNAFIIARERFTFNCHYSEELEIKYTLKLNKNKNKK